jgi:hypothetical protein
MNSKASRLLAALCKEQLFAERLVTQTPSAPQSPIVLIRLRLAPSLHFPLQVTAARCAVPRNAIPPSATGPPAATATVFRAVSNTQANYNSRRELVVNTKN